MTRRFRTRIVVATAVGVALSGFVVGCASGPPAPHATAMTTAAAAAYYASTTCDLNAAENDFTVALLNAEQSTESTGADLDALTAAAGTYQSAARAAVSHLTDPKAVWPKSVRKSIAVLTAELRSMIAPLGAMAHGKHMADEQAGYRRLPDNSGAAAAVKEIHTRLGIPSGGSDACPAPAPTALTAAPATGLSMTGSGYSFHVPAGWTLPRDPVKADAYAISAQPDANGVYDTVNVLLGPPSTESLDTQQRTAAEYLEQAVGATQVKIRPRIEVAGDESVHISSQQSRNGVTEWSEQYAVQHGKTAFTITFNFHDSEPQADRDTVAESVLASWTWA